LFDVPVAVLLTAPPTAELAEELVADSADELAVELAEELADELAVELAEDAEMAAELLCELPAAEDWDAELLFAATLAAEELVVEFVNVVGAAELAEDEAALEVDSLVRNATEDALDPFAEDSLVLPSLEEPSAWLEESALTVRLPVPKSVNDAKAAKTHFLPALNILYRSLGSPLKAWCRMNFTFNTSLIS